MVRAKNDSKPRGRTTAYAYFVQSFREEQKKKNPGESINFSVFSRKCADYWKSISDDEKKRFQDMAEKDKQRYESEMKNFVPEKNEANEKNAKKAKKSTTKDPNAPKKPLPAYFWFCNDERPKLKLKNPEFGTISNAAKELGRMWGDIDHEAKEKYAAMAERDKERYNKEMVKYTKRKTKDESEDEEEMEDEEDTDNENE